MTITDWHIYILEDPSPNNLRVYADWLEDGGASEKTVRAWREAATREPLPNRKVWWWINSHVCERRKVGFYFHETEKLPLEIFKFMVVSRDHPEERADWLLLLFFDTKLQARRALVAAMLELYPVTAGSVLR